MEKKENINFKNMSLTKDTKTGFIIGDNAYDVICKKGTIIERYDDGQIKSFTPKKDLLLKDINISGIKQNVKITGDCPCEFYENGQIKSFVPEKRAKLNLNINNRTQQITISGDNLFEPEHRKCEFYENGQIKSFAPTSKTTLYCKIGGKEKCFLLDHYQCRFHDNGQLASFYPKGSLLLKNVNISGTTQDIDIKDGEYCSFHDNGQLASFYPKSNLLLKNVNISGTTQDIKINGGNPCNLYKNGNLKSCNVADNIALHNLKINGCEEEIKVLKNTDMSLYENGKIEKLCIDPIKYSTNILNNKIPLSGIIDGYTSFDESGDITSTYAKQITANLCLDKNKQDILNFSNNNFKIIKYDKDIVIAFLSKECFIHDDGDYLLVGRAKEKYASVDIYKRNKDNKNYTFIENKDLGKFKSNGWQEYRNDFFHHVTDNFYKTIKPELEKKEINNGEANYFNNKGINPSERLMLKDW